MECAQHHLLTFHSDQSVNPVSHFVRGLVCKRDSENFVWQASVGENQVGGSISDNAGFARPGSGEHQHRALECFNRTSLLGVEIGFQYFVKSGQFDLSPDRHTHVE